MRQEVISLVDSWPNEQELPDRFAMLLETRVANPVIAFEEALLDAGYMIDYEDFRVGGFDSQIAIASDLRDDRT